MLAFAGRVGDAAATLLPSLKDGSSLVKNPLTAEQLLDWRDCIEQLARDFVTVTQKLTRANTPRPASAAACKRSAAFRRIGHNWKPKTMEDEEADDE